jgi:hypothetical protein
MNQDQILGIVRHVLTGVGGVLVTKGYLDDGMLQTAVGGLIAIAGVVWSVLAKKKTAPAS